MILRVGLTNQPTIVGCLVRGSMPATILMSSWRMCTRIFCSGFGRKVGAGLGVGELTGKFLFFVIVKGG